MMIYMAFGWGEIKAQRENWDEDEDEEVRGRSHARRMATAARRTIEEAEMW